MRLIDSDGPGVELGVVGYQFPDAVDQRQRQSRLIAGGAAHCPQGMWWFRRQALTADDAVELARWLSRAADRPSGPRTRRRWPVGVHRAELGLCRQLDGCGSAELGVSLDAEFSPPWRRRDRAGAPFVVTCRLTVESVARAAPEWAAEIEPCPPASDGDLP